MRPERIGLGVTLALHALAAAALLSYEPARRALLAAAPIMVHLIAPPSLEPPKPQLPAHLPNARPVTQQIQHPSEAPVVAAPTETPSAVMAPSAPAPIEVAAAPAPLTPPVFHAAYLDNPAPAYPPLSRRLGEQGRVILHVLVNVRGGADEVQLSAASGFARLDEAARDTVRRWKFVPARRGADPVPAWVLIPITFRLEG